VTENGLPGVVIHHTPAHTEKYVGCPSICILPNGTYVASHSHFGPGASNTDSFVYSSADRGDTWQAIAEIQGQIWSSLFFHDGSLYIMGTNHCNGYGGRLNGGMVVRRSEDGGSSWTTPTDEHCGLLSDADGFHTAPVPVLHHAGRLWRAMEYAPQRKRLFWRAFMLSIADDADLLDRGNWVMSEMIDPTGYEIQWTEGNALVDRNGSVIDLLRVNYHDALYTEAAGYIDRAAIVHVSEDGRYLTHHPDYDVITMPGGGTKFTVRFDPESDRYWALVNKQLDPEAIRNRLHLVSTADLQRWTTQRLLLSHPDTEHHAFQYVDWAFDGEDIVYVSRTAHDDEEGGAHNFHDVNYLTFHRVKSFRKTKPERVC